MQYPNSTGEDISASEVDPWILCLSSFNHLALIFNASTNFVIYFARGDHFKMTVLRILQSWHWYVFRWAASLEFTLVSESVGRPAEFRI